MNTHATTCALSSSMDDVLAKCAKFDRTIEIKGNRAFEREDWSYWSYWSTEETWYGRAPVSTPVIGKSGHFAAKGPLRAAELLVEREQKTTRYTRRKQC